MSQCVTIHSYRILLLACVIAVAGSVGVATAEEEAPHTFEQCSEALQSKDPSIRIAALQELSAFYPRKGLLPIMEHLSEETDEDVLCEMARSIALTKHPRGAEFLIEMMKGNSLPKPVRMVMIQALGYLQSPQSIDALYEMAREENSHAVLIAMYRALAQTPKAQKAVLELAKRELNALIRQDKAQTGYSFSQIDVVSRRLAALGPMAASPMYAVLETSHWQAARAAAVAIGKMRPPGGDARLLGAMKRHSRMTWQCMEGLQFYAEPRTIPALLQMPNATKYGRWYLAMICGRAGDQRAIGFLSKMVQHDYEATAAWSIALIGGEKALTFLMSEFEKGVDGREWLCAALAKLGDPRAVPLLLNTATDTHEMLDFRKAAAYTLAWCGEEATVKQLEDAIKNEKTEDVKAAMERTLDILKHKVEVMKNPPQDHLECESLKVLSVTRGKVFSEMPLPRYLSLSYLAELMEEGTTISFSGGPEDYSGYQALSWHALTFGDELVLSFPVEEDFYGKFDLILGTGDVDVRLRVTLDEDPFGKEFSLSEYMTKKKLSLGNVYLPKGNHKLTLKAVDLSEGDGFYFIRPEFMGLLLLDYIQMSPRKAPEKKDVVESAPEEGNAEPAGPAGGW